MSVVRRLLRAYAAWLHRRTAADDARRASPGGDAGVVAGLSVGFKSLVALRYLMPLHRRISRVVVVLVAIWLAIALGAWITELAFVEHKAPNAFELEGGSKLFAQIVSGVKLGGLGLAGFTFLVGILRYNFTFFTTVPLVGVWIGTWALVCVLSVMTGFETDLRDKILGSNAHIQVSREDGDFTEWRDIKKRVDATPGVVASTPFAESEIVIATDNNGMNVIIRGIDPDSVGHVTKLVENLDEPEAMARLQPQVADTRAPAAPQAPRAPGGIDPPPPELPIAGDPIDYSKPLVDAGAASADDAGAAATDDAVDGGARAASDPIDGAPATNIDPPPPDLVTLDDPPIDYSAPRGGSTGNGSAGSGSAGGGSGSSAEPTVHVTDTPTETPTSRRVASLPGILVGRELVHQTHVYVGKEVRVVSPLSDPANPDATGTPIPFNRDFRVAGVFFSGMYEYDLKRVYVTLDALQDFLDRGDAIDGIEVRLASADDTDAMVQTLADELGPQYRVQDWKDLNRSLFSALKLEKIAMFLVLGIVILVASFSIVGNLIMVVVEKQREIALLKTLGASDTNIMKVFAIQGLIIGMIGTLIGVVTGLASCWAAKRYGIPLNPDVYYIDRLPVQVEPMSVVVTAIAGVGISILATFHPALLAARVRPAAGLRH